LPPSGERSKAVMVMVIERLLLGEHHRLRRQTFATMAERLPWNGLARLYAQGPVDRRVGRHVS